MTVCTHFFAGLGEVEGRALGMPDLPLAIAPHPIGGLKTGLVRAKADTLLEQVVSGLTRG